MATVLERYYGQKKELNERIKKKEPVQDIIFFYPELLYRLQVIETFQMFQNTAPVTQEAPILLRHYQMFDAFSQWLLKERQFPQSKDEKIQKRRETAYGSFVKVVQDYRKRFSSFAPSSEEQYKKEIINVISVVMPVWFQYRATLINID